ncbi:hypothetical protein MTR67_043300 [Solanum verrucosum]|uniref:Retroviral polymerase SH3-like domain-containing protein n=1 Tax=Solanum verrucosum TaxID=315347 RepID=A0AAF0UNU4_SOLVR|nr:hypothetical protein MTR67_043300 [Solanum verrucosum]
MQTKFPTSVLTDTKESNSVEEKKSLDNASLFEKSSQRDASVALVKFSASHYLAVLPTFWSIMEIFHLIKKGLMLRKNGMRSRTSQLHFDICLSNNETTMSILLQAANEVASLLLTNLTIRGDAHAYSNLEDKGLWLLNTQPGSFETLRVSLTYSAPSGVVTMEYARSGVLNEEMCNDPRAAPSRYRRIRPLGDEFGYRFFDLVEKKLIRSRNVVFFEDQTIEALDKDEKVQDDVVGQQPTIIDAPESSLRRSTREKIPSSHYYNNECDPRGSTMPHGWTHTPWVSVVDKALQNYLGQQPTLGATTRCDPKFSQNDFTLSGPKPEFPKISLTYSEMPRTTWGSMSRGPLCGLEAVVRQQVPSAQEPKSPSRGAPRAVIPLVDL